MLGVSRYLLVTRAGMGVLSFGYAQLLHSATLAAGYVAFAVNGVVAENSSPSSAAQQTTPPPQPNPQASARDSPAGQASASSLHPEASETRSDNDRGFASIRGWLPRRPTRDHNGPGAGPGPGPGPGAGVEEGSWVDRGKLRLAGALAGQSLLKHVLTEGDKIVLARATSLGQQGCGGGSGGGGDGSVGTGGCGGQSAGGSLYEQGVYAIASGYGSLAARLLFQPLEEAARLMFSKLGAEEGEGGSAGQRDDGSPPPAAATSGPDGPGAPSVGAEGLQLPAGSRGRRRGRQDGDREDCDGGGGGDGGDGGDDGGRTVAEDRLRLRERMAALLATLLKLVLTAGLVFVCFGFHYTETLLRLLLAGKGGGGGGGGRSGAVPEVARVLSWYCVYVLFLAANGMCEAFACAVARGGHLAGMGAGLVVSFAAFWALVGPLTARYCVGPVAPSSYMGSETVPRECSRQRRVCLPLFGPELVVVRTWEGRHVPRCACFSSNKLKSFRSSVNRSRVDRAEGSRPCKLSSPNHVSVPHAIDRREWLATLHPFAIRFPSPPSLLKVRDARAGDGERGGDGLPSCMQRRFHPPLLLAGHADELTLAQKRYPRGLLPGACLPRRQQQQQQHRAAAKTEPRVEESVASSGSRGPTAPRRGRRHGSVLRRGVRGVASLSVFCGRRRRRSLGRSRRREARWGWRGVLRRHGRGFREVRGAVRGGGGRAVGRSPTPVKGGFRWWWWSRRREGENGLRDFHAASRGCWWEKEAGGRAV